MATWKEKYNKKYGYKKDKSHSLNAISKKTGVSKKGLQKIYNKGIGAWKTNIGSVRLKGSFKKNPNTKKYPRKSRIGKQQWAMARVYSAVMGGKASKVDAKELKMEMGGLTDTIINCNTCNWSWNESEGGNDKYVCYKCGTDNTPNKKRKFNRKEFYKGYYKNLTPSDMEVTATDDNKVVIDLNKKEFATGGVTTAIVTDPNEAMADLQSTYGFGEVYKEGGGVNYDYDSYTTFDEESKTNVLNGVQYIIKGEYTLVARALYFKDKDLFAYYKYLQRLNITLEDCQKFALSLNEVFTEMLCNIKVNKLEDKKRSFASCKITAYNSLDSNSTYSYSGNINGNLLTISTPVYMACCNGMFLERLSGKPIPSRDLKNYYSFQTLIHELAHCLDFQYQFKQGKLPVLAHKEYFLNALYKIIYACKDGKLPLAKSFGVRAKALKRISVLTKGKI